ncbi:nitrous oxide reductase family maturation protein NosD [Hydrotalea sp.]|uniref:nitrous oxide reductase family maturation protein NosD n=1 Tax=Hydrotalea sp. TaxID=2881279 RepID=UPI002630D413|nr:nitrous oxide reductase family maturation protein NosD [Hydrotalea sp.]
MKPVFLCIGFLLSVYCTPISAVTLHVAKGHSIYSIQQAVNMAKNGDTILVAPGNYKEKNITINKPIVLLGNNYPVIDGEHTYQLISVRADGVIIKGFKLIHSGTSSLIDIAGIKVYDVKNITIENNILEDTFFGIYLQGATHCTIKNNRLTAYAKTDQQSANGIHCWKCDSLSIIGNTVTGHRDGIYFEFVTNSLIWKNRSIKNSRYGLHFMFSHNDAYIANIFQNNSAGVSVMFTHGVSMLNNVFEDNWGDGCYGIFLKEITDSHISGNTFLRNTTAIFFEGATRILVEKNTFIKNGWAVKIQANSIQNTIKNNNFLANSFDIATNGSLVENTFNKNYWDKYEGYDLNKDGVGDVPYHPVSMFSMIVAENPTAMILFRSFMATLFDKTEKILPSLTPENLVDKLPLMKPLRL